MQKEFVTHTIALKLKKLGFDEPCFGYYTPIKDWMISANPEYNSEPHFIGPNWINEDMSFYFMYKANSFGDRTETVSNSKFIKTIENVTVPLWQQVIDWFDTKGIFITIRPYYHNTTMKYGWILDHGKLIAGVDFNSRYKANENAIIEAIALYESFLKEIENE